ncbi:hypothetical protein AVEN_40880-1 [Araneus ventricosus]|uniref:Uncharacterized protein n=1 Tax=Araneus ventricosus TaxID=182803 RepID=A0A4Y2S9B2_ARAVE|nr:hypothetical protein AVEN_40880-1 [Araneus ventricosus]
MSFGPVNPIDSPHCQFVFNNTEPIKPLCSAASGHIARGSGRHNGSKDGCEVNHVSPREHGIFHVYPFNLQGIPWVRARGLKQHEDYVGTDLVILNCSGMTKMIYELAPPLQASAPDGGSLTPYSPRHGGSSVESVFEPGTLEIQGLTTKPPRPHLKKRKYHLSRILI